MPLKDPVAKSAYNKAYTERNKKKLLKYAARYRRENQAKIRRGKKAYYRKNKRRINAKGRQRHREAFAANPTKMRRRLRLFYRRNRARISEQRRRSRRYKRLQKAWRKRNRQRLLQLHAAWKKKHPRRFKILQQLSWNRRKSDPLRKQRRKQLRKRWCTKNRDHMRKWMRAYYKTPKYRAYVRKSWARWLEKNARYRARKLGIDAKCAKEVVAFYQRIRSDKVVHCHWCKKVIPKGKRTADHYIPLCRGGTHSAKNLRPCCQSCNSSKGGRLPDEFRRYLRKC